MNELPDERVTARARARLYAMVLILCAVAVTMLDLVTDNGQELTYDSEGDAGWAVVIAIALGLLCLVATLRGTRLSVRAFMSAFIASSLVAFVWCPVAMGVLMRGREIADFTGVVVAQRERDLPVDLAVIHHGRSLSYRVWLRDYPVLLHVTRGDYLATLGQIERVRPIGICVRAVVQTAGKASRIMVEHGYALPTGSLVHCSSAR